MRRALTVTLGIVCMALLLAFVQMRLGVHTDEAKYLLNVPYPHPPLARWLLSRIDGWFLQEQCWRIVLAVALLQSGWIAADLVDRRYPRERIAALCAWLGGAAVLLQAGTVMMAPLSAMALLVFLWLLRRPSWTAGAIGLLWLASLATAYQGVLALPVVWAALRRGGASRLLTLGIVGMPLLLLALYTLTNPLAAAALLGRGSGDGAGHWGDVAVLLGMAGSFLGTGIALWGLGRAHRAVVASFALTLAYVLTSSPHEYYAVLFAPFLAYGMAHALEAVPSLWRGVLVGVPLIGVSVALATLSSAPVVPARATAALLSAEGIRGVVLLQEPFGHEWQYELPNPILRFEPHLLPRAEAVICPANCPALPTWGDAWVRLETAPVETWIRR